MKASDRAVRWMDRVFYVTVAASVVIALPAAIRNFTDYREPAINLMNYIAAVTAWLYAMWTRERKPPRD